MTTRIGTNVVHVIEAASGCLLVLVNGKLLHNRSFIFQADAISAAKKEIFKQTK